MTTRDPAARLSTESLYAALFIPDFPVAVLQQGNQWPVAAVWGQAPNRFVYAANALARARGVREGMALAAAAARCSTGGAAQALRAFKRAVVGERRMQQELLQLAESVTPRFEDVAPGVLALDLGGLREPYATTLKLVAGAARLGLEANVGVARNRLVALCAARVQQGVTHVYPGQETGFLRALPLDALPLDDQDSETLARWGVRTVGELERLPPEQLAGRFGERGARMIRLARGQQDSLLTPCQPRQQFELGRDFDGEVGDLDQLVLAISALLDRLCFKLQGLDRAMANVMVVMRLAGGEMFERSISLPSPLSDARTLLKLVRIDLAAHPPGKAVEGVSVSAKPAARQRVQQSLFEPGLPSPQDLAVTLARLEGLVGSGRLGAPVVPDTHRPGAATVCAFRVAEVSAASRHKPKPGPSPPESGLQGSSSSATPSRNDLVFRCFRPSRSAEVTLVAGRPVRVEAQDVRGAVTACAGPWHVSGEWWTPDGWQYQEWDVEVQGSLYRAGCERSTGTWFLAGEYD